MDFLIHNPVQNNYYNIITSTNNINDITYAYLQGNSQPINSTFPTNNYDFALKNYTPQNYYYPKQSETSNENYGIKNSQNIYYCNNYQNETIPLDNTNSILNNKNIIIDSTFKNPYDINTTNIKEKNDEIKEKINNTNYNNQTNKNINKQSNSTKNTIISNNPVDSSVNKRNYKLTIINHTSKASSNKNKIPTDSKPSATNLNSKYVNFKRIHVNDNTNINNIKNINNINNHLYKVNYYYKNSENINFKSINNDCIINNSNNNSNNNYNINFYTSNNNNYNNNFNNNYNINNNKINNDLNSGKFDTKIDNNNITYTTQETINSKQNKEIHQINYCICTKKNKVVDNTDQQNYKHNIKNKSSSNIIKENFSVPPEKLSEKNIYQIKDPKSEKTINKIEKINLVNQKEKDKKKFERKSTLSTPQNNDIFNIIDYQYFPNTARNNINKSPQENLLIKKNDDNNEHYLTEKMKTKDQNHIQQKIKKASSIYLNINKNFNEISSINTSSHKTNHAKDISFSYKRTRSPSINSANKGNNYNTIINKRKIKIFSSYKNFGKIKLGEKNEERFSLARKDEFLGGGKKDRFIGRIKKDLENIKNKRNIKAADNSMKLSSSKSNNIERLTINNDYNNDNTYKNIQKKKNKALNNNYIVKKKKENKISIRNNSKNLNSINSYSKSFFKVINNKLIPQNNLSKDLKNSLFQIHKEKDNEKKSHNNLNLYGYFDKINESKSIKDMPIKNIDISNKKIIDKRLNTPLLNNKINLIENKKINKKINCENRIIHKRKISKNTNTNNISQSNKNNFSLRFSNKTIFPNKKQPHQNSISSQKNIKNTSKNKSIFFTRKTIGGNETSPFAVYNIKKSDKNYNQKFKFRPRLKGKHKKNNISIDIKKNDINNNIFKLEKKNNLNNQIISYDNLDIKNMLNKIYDNEKKEEENVPYLNNDNSENTENENNDTNKFDNKNYILDLNNVIPIDETELFYKMFKDDNNININDEGKQIFLSKIVLNDNTNTNKENNIDENSDINSIKTNRTQKVIKSTNKDKNEITLDKINNKK